MELYPVGLIDGLSKISVLTEKSYIAVLAKVLFEFTHFFEILGAGVGGGGCF